MPTYTVSSKKGEVLEIVEASTVTSVRVDASRTLLEIHQSTTAEIMAYAKDGREVRVLSKKDSEKSGIDPAQTDLEAQIREQNEAEASAAEQAAANAAAEEAAREQAEAEAADAQSAEAEAKAAETEGSAPETDGSAAAAFDFP